MTSESQNLSRVLAEGFYSVYVKHAADDVNQQAAIANLAAIFERVYAQGMNRGQMNFAEKLVHTIGQRSEVPATELTSLASSLPNPPY